MKNLTLFLFAFMLVITACNDEEITAPKNEKAPLVAESASDPKFIVFESVNEYDSILDTLSNMNDSMLLAWAQGFVGYNCRLAVSSESQLEADGIYDEVLATILSELNIVQIDEHVFQLNFSTEEVYALHENDFDNPSDFNSENANMDVYSFGDDVLDAVANKTHTNCNKEKDGPLTWSPSSGSGGTLKRKIVYQRAGLYHSIIIKHKKNYRGQLNFGFTRFGEKVEPADSFFYKVRGATQPTLISQKSFDNGGRRRAYSVDNRFYVSRTPLVEFEVAANFYYELPGGGGSNNDVMSISCGH
ncbi:MAG: hypothetical protein ACPGLV_02450 [Bacteroidia bacterium]